MAAVPLRVHAANPTPFVTFTNVEREVEVSLWGNIAVEEFFTLKHTGAVLRDGLFSRIDYMQGHIGNSFRSLTGNLPAGAMDVYYRDIIGNISTSNLRSGLQGSTLHIETRFPVFGGWSTEWYQGFNLPTEHALTRSGDTFRLEMPLAITYPVGVTDEFVVKVVLPEGASNLQVQPVAGMAQVDAFKRFTYLDAVQGRPVLELRSENVIKAHQAQLVVTFDMPPTALLREPAMLVGTFLSLFLAGSLLSRVRMDVDS
jgi:oligosaccharyltransferase complex subunit alpha (ribophorin I)